MARRRKKASTAVRVIRAPAPRAAAPIIRVSAPGPARRARRVASRVGGRVQSAALSERHTVTALVAAAVLGLAERSGVNLPKPISSLSVPATYGVAAWALGKWTKNQQWQHAATGLLAIAIRDMAAGKTPAGTVVGDDDVQGVGVVYDVEGDDD
jgi:hypothetical protein